MEVDHIILGQGICGTFLSYYLLKLGKKVLVIDEPLPFTASKVASGVINPVTGRRIVKTWLIDELLPFALDAYTAIGNELNTPLIRQCSLLDFHPTPQMKEAFTQRMEEDPQYLHTPNEIPWHQYFRFNYGIGEIAPCLLIDIQTLLSKWRQKLKDDNLLIEQRFDFTRLTLHPSGITYQLSDSSASIAKSSALICCEGVSGFDNPYFNRLPYVRTKGEALIADIPGLPSTHIYKQGISIVPWQDGLFWIGSSYEWDYADANPTTAFRYKTEQQLNYLLKLPYRIIDHLSSERPANVERRPFVGLHPLHNSIGILNGMGTKGCSLAPFFAQQLAAHLAHNALIDILADVKRFKRILSK